MRFVNFSEIYKQSIQDNCCGEVNLSTLPSGFSLPCPHTMNLSDANSIPFFNVRLCLYFKYTFSSCPASSHFTILHKL